MPILVSFLANDGNSAAYVDRYPEACPVCHVLGAPRFVAAATQTPQLRQICFQCMSRECRALFVATYAAQTAHDYALVVAVHP